MNATVTNAHQLMRNAQPIGSRARFDLGSFEGADGPPYLTFRLTLRDGALVPETPGPETPRPETPTCILPADSFQLKPARTAAATGRPVLSPSVDRLGRTIVLAYMPQPVCGQPIEVRLVSMLTFGDALHDAARELGASKLAARVCRALVENGSLRRASRSLGIAHQTASSEIKDAMRLAGVNSQSGLVHRLADRWLTEPLWSDRAIDLLQSTFGLTPRDARAGALRALGYRRHEAAAEMGVSQWAMETSCSNVFATLGVSKAPELTRILVDLLLAADLAER